MNEPEFLISTWFAFWDHFWNLVPDDPWNAAFLWKVINCVLDPWWWKYKAAAFGIAAFCVVLWPMSSMTPWIRRSRMLCATGGAVIAGSLANPGLGPIGDVIFATGFCIASVLLAKCGIEQRREQAEREHRTIYPEALLLRWVTNQLKPTSRKK